MISFVWSPGEPLPAGTGGSENYTIGQVRELLWRGIPAQVVTIGVGEDDGRSDFPDIPFLSLGSPEQVSRLRGLVIFVTFFPELDLPGRAFQMLHIPPPVLPRDRLAVRRQVGGRIPIATSRFAAQLWAEFLEKRPVDVNVVYPFAEPTFAVQPRRAALPGRARVLFAGRLTPEKGIFTLLAMLHNELLGEIAAGGTQLSFTVTTAGSDKPQGAVIRRMLAVHPGIDLVPARKSPQAMAALVADHDIVVMPSNSQYWHETFGIVSVEAQHAGCRVVASDDGGLPETDCGGLTLVEPDNAASLAVGIMEAIMRGPLSPTQRRMAATRFTVRQSVDALLSVLGRERIVVRPVPALRPVLQGERRPLIESAVLRTTKHRSPVVAVAAKRSKQSHGPTNFSVPGR